MQWVPLLQLGVLQFSQRIAVVEMSQLSTWGISPDPWADPVWKLWTDINGIWGEEVVVAKNCFTTVPNCLLNRSDC